MAFKKPNFFIVGGPKCGTTALSRYLNEHPQIYFSNPKEAFYFNSDFEFERPRFSSDQEYIKACFPKIDSYEFVGEGTVLYLYSAVAIDNILEFNPKAKFIVMIRNPIEMSYSLFSTWRKLGIEDADDFATAWNLQSKRLNGDHLPSYFWDRSMFDYGGICKLGEQIEILLSKVRREHIHFIFYSDFKHDTRTSYEGVLDFLNAERDGRVEFPVANANAEIRSGLIAKIISKLSIRLYWVSTLKEKLGVPRGVGLLTSLRSFNQKERKRESISDELNSRLKAYFAEDIKKLEKIFNRDLSEWYKN